MLCTHSAKSIRLFFTAVMLALALLAGCRSSSKETPTPAPPAAQAEAPTQAAAEPQPEPATEVPAAAPETPAEQATEVPADAPAAQEESAEGVALWRCDHPYFPIKEGVTWRYRSPIPDQPDAEMTISYRITGPDTVVSMQTMPDGVVVETEWLCTEEGLIHRGFGMTGMDMEGMAFEITDISGISLPLPDEFQAGHTWQTVFHMSGEMSAEGFAMTLESETVMDNVLTAFEEVTTPAGTFEAARVDTTATVHSKSDAFEMPAVSFSSTTWYVKDVGMVKVASAEADGGVLQELVAME